MLARRRREREGSHRKVAKPPVFSGEAGKVLEFITACKLYMNDESNSGGASAVGVIFCIGRVSRYLKGKHIGRFGRRSTRI